MTSEDMIVMGTRWCEDIVALDAQLASVAASLATALGVLNTEIVSRGGQAVPIPAVADWSSGPSNPH